MGKSLYDVVMYVLQKPKPQLSKPLFGDIMHDPAASEELKTAVLHALEDAHGYENLPDDPEYVVGKHKWREGWETV